MSSERQLFTTLFELPTVERRNDDVRSHVEIGESQSVLDLCIELLLLCLGFLFIFGTFLAELHAEET